MIFLDTHAIVFLYADQERIPRLVWPYLDKDRLVCSPMARLELDFLYEIGRITEDPRAIIAVLEQNYGLRIENEAWSRAAQIAGILNWTRDPFDRLITAHALTWGAPLLTRDRLIKDHYHRAFWDTPPEI